MKVLILSDIHANYPALQAILTKEGNYDKLIFLGDVVDYGPHPKECLKFIKENADYYVRGNHDNAIGYDEDCNCMGTFREYSIETRKWHKTILDEDDFHFLRNMPLIDKAHIDDNTFFLAHASPSGNMFKYLNEEEIVNELELSLFGSTLIEDTFTEYILVGHTHVQYKKKVDYNLIVNPGSVGLARDGGQACYAVYEDKIIKLKRIEYDVEKTISDLKKSPLPKKVVLGLEKILLHK